MPRLRPRCAMLTRPVTKSGSSRTIEANSSMTMSSRGIGVRRSGFALQQLDVVLDVLGAGRGEDVLAPGQLRRQRHQGPLDEVGVEVGDHADGVRQVHAVLERGAALVVDEDERHRVRAVRHRERGDQRLEELGLAGAGGAGDQPVRAVALEVQGERAVQGDADGRPGRAAPGRPARADTGGLRRIEGEDVEQPRGTGEHRGLLVGAARVPQRAHRPGQRAAPVQGHRVGPDAPDGAPPGATNPHGAAGLLDDDGVALLGEQPLLGVQADRADADGRSVAQDLRHAGQRTQPAGPVEDDEHVRSGGPVPPVRRPARSAISAVSSATRRAQVSVP